MGHDIYGFANGDRECSGKSVAYLRRGAGNDLARDIYRALGAVEHDCGCSGCGTTAHFSEEQLRTALTMLPDDDDHEPERSFLRDCITKGGGGAWIGFW